MNQKQRNKYSMKLVLCEFFEENGGVAATLPNFGQLLHELKANIGEIEEVSRELALNKSGIAEKKKVLREDLIDCTYMVCKNTEVYARMASDTILAGEVHYTQSQLKKAAYAKLIDIAVLVHDKANERIAELGAYGIMPTALEALNNATVLLKESLPSTRIGTAESKEANARLAQLFKQNNEILGKFDLLVELVRTTQPMFYSGYKLARKVVKTGKRTMALKVVVTDAATGERIKGAKATIVLKSENGKAATTKGKKPLEKVTGQKGIFHVKNMAEGMYEITIAKTGYVSVTITQAICKGEYTMLEAKLEQG